MTAEARGNHTERGIGQNQPSETYPRVEFDKEEALNYYGNNENGASEGDRPQIGHRDGDQKSKSKEQGNSNGEALSREQNGQRQAHLSAPPPPPPPHSSKNTRNSKPKPKTGSRPTVARLPADPQGAAEQYEPVYQLTAQESVNLEYFMGSLRLKMDKLEKENDQLKIQLAEREKDFMMTIDRFQPAMDSEIVQSVRSLKLDVRAFVKSITTIKDTSEKSLMNNYLEHTLAGLVEVEPWNGTFKLRFIESAMWKLLVDFFFTDLFAVFGPEFRSNGPKASNLRRTCALIFGVEQEEGVYHYVPTTKGQKWRSDTIQALQKRYDESDSAEKSVANFKRSALKEVFKFLEPFGDISGSQERALVSIVEATHNLSITLGKQRAYFEFQWPSVKSRFDPDTMEEAMLTEEHEDCLSGTVVFVSAPSLIKKGDGSGMNLEQGRHLTKAVVHYIPQVFEDS